MDKQTTKFKIYDNYKMLSPDGELLCFTNRAKYRWYIAKGLAENIESSDGFTTFRLRFEPKKRDKNIQVPRKNICACCNSNRNLTKHHIVPQCFFSYFQDDIKKHNNGKYTICLCYICHKRYEKASTKLRKHLSIKLQYPFDESHITKSPRAKAIKYADTLVKHQNEIPENKKKIMLDHIGIYLNKVVIEQEDLCKLARQRRKRRNSSNIDGYVPFGKFVLEKFNYDYNLVARMWLNHFYKTINKFKQDNLKKGKKSGTKHPRQKEPMQCPSLYR